MIEEGSLLTAIIGLLGVIITLFIVSFVVGMVTKIIYWFEHRGQGSPSVSPERKAVS